MKADSFIEDPELGRLLIRTDGRVRRLTFRTKAEGIYVTLPPGTPRQELLRAIEQLRPRLAEARRKMSVPHFDLNYRIDAECLRLSLVNGEDEKRFLIRSQPRIVEIACPPSTDFHNGDLQAWLRKVVVEALRKQAQAYLPSRLRLLSSRHNLPFRQVKINTSTGRWGSCSEKADINLSCFLMLLPSRLIDYVLLHELTHTREMNHGEAFWTLLNRLTDGQAYQLRDEIRRQQVSL